MPRMTEQIFAYQGMLKEYVGDELMAIFGRPHCTAGPCGTGLRRRPGHARAS